MRSCNCAEEVGEPGRQNVAGATAAQIATARFAAYLSECVA